MKAVDETLGDLLNRERRHLIPTYQRDYEWTEEGQWQLLMDDIFDVADRLSREREISVMRDEDIRKADERVGPHFLGALVLEALPQHGANIASALVIDGQQRLTTLHLMMRGLADVLGLFTDLSEREKQVRKQILILDRDDEQRYKLWPRRRDRDAWREAMEDGQTSSEHVYSQARIYFADRIRAEYQVDDPRVSQAAQKKLETLVDTILHKLKIVAVDLDSSDDAQLIFEVLNGRQTPLSATDLVKNLLFMQADARGDELDALYDQYWAALDDSWWSVRIGRGHAARGRRDQLLASWLTVQTAEEVNLGRLYGEARHFLTSEQRPLKDTLTSISELAREYRQIYERTGEIDTDVAEIYARVEKLGVTTLVPLFLWMSTLPQERMTPEQRRQALLDLDSYIMRRLLTGGQTRGYGRAFLQVLQAAQQADETEPVDIVIRQALLAAPNGLPWPDDEEVGEQVGARAFYGHMSQERIRWILGPIDRFMQRQNPHGEQPVFDYNSLTIEHVLPRDWQTHWPVSGIGSSDRQLAARERERHIHRLGNLTLVTKTLNPSLSNAAWPDKKAALQEHSQLALNADLAKYEAWDENAISQRAATLAAVACQVWPRPSSAPSEPI